MKLFLISCLTALSLTALIGCSCDNTRQTSTSYDSATVDSKDMHPRHHNQ